MSEPAYDAIAREYQVSKQLPFREHYEEHTIFRLLSDLSGRSVLDLACGEGIYSRKLKLRGAASVVGVDLSPEMIALAEARERAEPAGVEYVVGDVASLGALGRFDVVLASYLFNYARTADELGRFCRVVFENLKPGGVLVGFNDNPAHDPRRAPSCRKYGFEKIATEPRAEGDVVTYTLYNPDGAVFSFDNYYLSPATYEAAFAGAGFRSFEWARADVSEAGRRDQPDGFWDELVENAPLIGLKAVR
jgi:SAM-dependent methyltransferase